MDRVIIDVREPQEFAYGHATGAINIPLTQLPRSKRLPSMPKDTEIIVYCDSGNRSSSAQQYLQRIGFRNVKNGINRQHVEENYV